MRQQLGAAPLNPPDAIRLSDAAPPNALVGLTAISGSAKSWMRSDGAPALNVAISPTWTGNHIHSPTAGVAQTINGVAGQSGAIINSGNTATGAFADLRINRAGSTANSAEAGPGLLLYDSTAALGTMLQHSGGQFELWQYNGSVFSQALKITNAGSVTINAPSSGAALAVTANAGAQIAIWNGPAANAYMDYQRAGVLIGRHGSADSVIVGGSASDFGMSAPAGGLNFATGGSSTSRMSINSTGNVAIGPSTDSTLQVTGAGGSGLRIGYNSTAVNFYDASVHNMRDVAGTNLLQLNTSAAAIFGYFLQVNGSGSAKFVNYSNDATAASGGKISSQSGGSASGGNAGDIILIY